MLYFKFKQFSVYHDLCAMKVGTDGVLLGAWTNCNHVKSILDIGTGSGLIALMLAQRTNARIDAVDIDENAFKQAEINFNRSPFASQLKAYHAAVQEFHPKDNYDLIVSNPPFFSASLKSPDEQRNKARHTNLLNLEELFFHSKHLLASEGRLSLILPFDQEQLANELADKHSFFSKRKTLLFPTPESKPKRILLEYSLKAEKLVEDQIIIEISRHQYSQEYIQLTQDYYLKF